MMRYHSKEPTPSRCASRYGVAAAAGLGLVILAGCMSSRSSANSRPLPPKPRPIQPAPADARADALVLNVSVAPLDTNGNGYPDLIMATAHLFDTRYPTAIWEDGAFVFHLYASGDVGRPEAAVIREWRVEGEDLARSRSAFGECYSFRLSLLDGGTDRLPINMADIQAWFEPADGRAATYVRQVTSIRIGRRILVPQLEWEESSETARRGGLRGGKVVLDPAR